jgi:chaperonin cofactor prefoldin
MDGGIRVKREELEAIRERAEDTSFEKAYVKGDPWKGYEVKGIGNGMTIAEVSCGADAEFIAHAREDIPKLLTEIERLRAENSSLCPIGDLEVITSLKVEKQYMAEQISELENEVERLRADQERLITELKKADEFSEELERKYMASKWPEVIASISSHVMNKRRERGGNEKA